MEADAPSADVTMSELLMSSGPTSMSVKGMKITVPFIWKAAFKIFALVISIYPDNNCEKSRVAFSLSLYTCRETCTKRLSHPF